MAANTTTSLSNQYQRYFSKQLLEKAVDTLVLNQFAKKADLPTGLGSKTIRFFRPVTAASANVQSLTEGTPIAVFTDLSYTAVDIDLAQFGEAMKWTDLLGWTALLKVMDDGIQLMGEDCALKADDLTLAVLAHATTGGTKRYSGGAADYTALKALTTSTGKFTADDVLDAMTKLTINKAPRINGSYVGIVPPQIARDIMKDSVWVNVSTHSAADQLFKGEIGTLYGVRIILTTNYWGEDATEGTRDTTPVAGQVWLSIFTGRDAYGVVSLSGQSPYSPDIMICNEPDKSDPANQFTTATWKAFYQAAVLNSAWVVAHRSQSPYSLA